jgi:hypothetical protein
MSGVRNMHGRDWKRPLVRPRRRWEDNIKVDLKGAGCKDIDWIQMAQDRVQCLVAVNSVMNLISVKGAVFFDYVSECLLLKKNCVPWP